MLQKRLPFTLAILGSCLMILTLAPVSAQVSKDTQLTEKIKADVAALGSGARISIKLRDKTELTGYVSQIGENDFVVTKANQGSKQTIAYADVAQVKEKQKHISMAGKILIVLGVLAVIGAIANGGS